MSNLLKYTGIAMVLSCATTFAHANGDRGRHNPPPPPPPPPCHPPAPHTGNVAPEVDPSMALGGLSLLGGTLTVLRARRRS